MRVRIACVLLACAATAAWADARWIAGAYVPPAEEDYGAFFEDAPAPVLKTVFRLDAAPQKAVWRIACLGLCDAFVNDKRITPTALPLWTSYGVRVLEDVYDVTQLLHAGGENELRLALGNGWYNLLPMKMWGRYNLRRNLAQGTPCVRAELEIIDADGRKKIVQTDESWVAAAGPVLRNSLYLGEKFDARRVPGRWEPVREVKPAVGRVEPRGEVPPVVIYDRWRARSVTAHADGTYVVDFGVNFAGTMHARLRGAKAGDVITFRYGELLETNGTVNVRTACAGQIKDPKGPQPGVAEQCDQLICTEAAIQDYEPRFTYHAFRYMQVSGLRERPKSEDFEAQAWSADVKDSASFRCSNERLNQLREVCRRTFRSNLQGVQSDCPGRERFGYGGDLACTAEAFLLNYDMAAFYRKVLRDQADAASLNGGFFTSVAPNAFPSGTGYVPTLGWTLCVPLVADLLLRYAGDEAIVAEIYPAIVRHLDACARLFSPEDVPLCIGDHEAVSKGDRKAAAQCFYHQALTLAVKFARRLGNPEDALRFAATAERLERVFADAARYVPVRGFVGDGLQGEEAFAIWHRMLPPDDLDAAYGLLCYNVMSHGNALTTGIFGTQYLLEILTERGDAALAGEIVMHEGYPGWMHMLDRGATTLWETWAEPRDIYSCNHPMFGSVAAWLMRGILGIQVCEDAVGCNRVRICPHAVAGVTWAEGHLDTPKGRISVSWKLEDGRLKVTKSLPPGVVEVLPRP